MVIQVYKNTKVFYFNLIILLPMKFKTLSNLKVLNTHINYLRLIIANDYE